jgi:hypothetical protein
MTNNSKRIFISFAIEAKPLAEEIALTLRKNGFDPWYFPNEMQGGQNWEKVQKIEMEKAVRCIGLISKAVTDDVKRERIVWKELHYAINRSENNGAYQSYLIPVIVNSTEIPEEIKPFHAIDFDKDGIHKIIDVLNSETPKNEPGNGTKIKTLLILLFAAITLIFGIYYINTLQNPPSSAPQYNARFQTQVIDRYTLQPVKDVIAYIINKNRKDTIAISDLSGSDGRVYFELDTSQRITVSVNFIHKDYVEDRLLFELPSSLVEPQFKLTPKIKPDTTKKKIVFPPISKYYWLDGAELTIEQRQKIKQSCGYEYKQGEGIKFTYDYDHSKFACTEVGCRFKGSEVILSGNGFSEQVGTTLPASSGIALSKTEWENEIKSTVKEHAGKNNEQIFSLLKKWLCAS